MILWDKAWVRRPPIKCLSFTDCRQWGSGDNDPRKTPICQNTALRATCPPITLTRSPIHLVLAGFCGRRGDKARPNLQGLCTPDWGFCLSQLLSLLFSETNHHLHNQYTDSFTCVDDKPFILWHVGVHTNV